MIAGNGGGKPVIDTVKTRTWFSAEHTSDAKTQSVTNTEETSHTRSESRSRTDGASVGDEITFELVYDHTVRPETLMALPEDQMLAPHVVAGVSAAAESRMVALVVDPSVVGTDAVASVSPHEIPAYEPPAPAVSSHVPDYERVPRAALGAGARPTRGSGGPPARPSAVQAIPARQQEEQRPDPPVIRAPSPSRTTMSTNEASQLDVTFGPPQL